MDGEKVGDLTKSQEIVSGDQTNEGHDGRGGDKLVRRFLSLACKVTLYDDLGKLSSAAQSCKLVGNLAPPRSNAIQGRVRRSGGRLFYYRKRCAGYYETRTSLKQGAPSIDYKNSIFLPCAELSNHF
jgi:hypothetical protein